MGTRASAWLAGAWLLLGVLGAGGTYLLRYDVVRAEREVTVVWDRWLREICHLYDDGGGFCWGRGGVRELAAAAGSGP